MAEYIERSAALDRLDEALVRSLKSGGGHEASGLVTAKCQIAVVPTADVVEVVHGAFAWISDDSPMCNICGKVFDTDDNADAGLWKFCPECGAKMDGERREGND